jgi:hypothetical protein
MFGWPKRKLNFLDVKSKQEFEFLAREEEKEHRLAMWQLTTHEFDEMAMASTDMRIQSSCRRGTSSMLRGTRRRRKSRRRRRKERLAPRR